MLYLNGVKILVEHAHKCMRFVVFMVLFVVLRLTHERTPQLACRSGYRAWPIRPPCGGQPDCAPRLLYTPLSYITLYPLFFTRGPSAYLKMSQFPIRIGLWPPDRISPCFWRVHRPRPHFPWKFSLERGQDWFWTCWQYLYQSKSNLFGRALGWIFHGNPPKMLSA